MNAPQPDQPDIDQRKSPLETFAAGVREALQPFGPDVVVRAIVVGDLYADARAAAERGITSCLAEAAGIWVTMRQQADTFSSWCRDQKIQRHGLAETMFVRVVFNAPKKPTANRYAKIIRRGAQWLADDPTRTTDALRDEINRITLHPYAEGKDGPPERATEDDPDPIAEAVGLAEPDDQFELPLDNVFYPDFRTREASDNRAATFAQAATVTGAIDQIIANAERVLAGGGVDPAAAEAAAREAFKPRTPPPPPAGAATGKGFKSKAPPAPEPAPGPEPTPAAEPTPAPEYEYHRNFKLVSGEEAFDEPQELADAIVQLAVEEGNELMCFDELDVTKSDDESPVSVWLRVYDSEDNDWRCYSTVDDDDIARAIIWMADGKDEANKGLDGLDFVQDTGSISTWLKVRNDKNPADEKGGWHYYRCIDVAESRRLAQSLLDIDPWEE